MADYKKMYLQLFNEISAALEDLSNQNYGLAKVRLMKAQLRTEAMYVEDTED